MSDIVTQLLDPEGAPSVEEEIGRTEEVSEGLISKEFFDYNLGAIYDYAKAVNPTHLINNIRYKNKEYLPLYAVNFKLDPTLPASHILTDKLEPSEYEKLQGMKHGGMPWQGNVVYVNFIKKCIEQRQYNMILFLKHQKDSNLKTPDELKESLMARFGEFVNSPVDIRVYKEGRYNAKNYADIMSNVKYYSGWSKSRTKRANVADPVVYFLTNFYYMAKLNELNGRHWIEPMFSVMIKKEYLQYIRACLITNTPIPVDALELWVDYKLDKTDSVYKIRSSFVSTIKTPFKKAGVKIVVHENLFEMLYERPTLPKFRTITERQEWIKGLSAKLVEKEKLVYFPSADKTSARQKSTLKSLQDFIGTSNTVGYTGLADRYASTVASLTQ